MTQILIFVIGAGIGGMVFSLVFEFEKREKKLGLIARQKQEKERDKEAILGLMESGNQPLTNNHIEQMLGIPDSTATRYLDELEKEGKVRQVGKTGQSVYYSKI